MTKPHNVLGFYAIFLLFSFCSCAPPAEYYKAESYMFAGQYDLAVKEYTKVIAKNPKDASSYVERGYTYLRNGQYDQAIADSEKAMELTKGDLAVYGRVDVFKDKDGKVFVSGRDKAQYQAELVRVTQNYKNSRHGGATLCRAIATIYKARKLEKSGQTAEALETYKNFIVFYNNLNIIQQNLPDMEFYLEEANKKVETLEKR